MALDTYANLKTAILSFLNRTDLASSAGDFITLAEADLQRRCKLVEFEATGTVTITAGSGALPTDFAGLRSVYWDGDVDLPLTYVTPKEFDDWREATSGDGRVYTISGSAIRTAPMGDGSVVLTYRAKFTALSDTNTSNALLANHPDVYLYGALKQAAVFVKDGSGITTYGGLMDQAVAGVKLWDDERRHAGPLEVRKG
jgi:hypothetical protein